MKKLALIALLALTLPSFAQKREKIKGSKNVTVVQKDLQPFENVEIEDNIEAYLVTGAAKAIEVEADDNLQEAIMTEVNGTTLRIYTSKEITAAKKIAVRINYTPKVKTIVTKHETILYALTDLQADSLKIKSIDFSKLYLNIKSKSLGLSMNDKTKAEINLKSENATVDLAKDATLKALISCKDFKMDMYQKTTAAIEGDVDNAVIRQDNMSEFTGKRFSAKKMELTTESYSKSSVMVAENLIMSASGKTVTEVFGNPDKLIITLKKFADSAVLAKKEDKDK
ncbi:GIN domain-containing protein [Flavobacterium sp. RHBU_3]|uniref:GIN domain-containing protein n=1 Tax=Flavobacterium sp. RHBU_3 TaxID=3391184 RepID=UPI003984D3E0